VTQRVTGGREWFVVPRSALLSVRRLRRADEVFATVVLTFLGGGLAGRFFLHEEIAPLTFLGKSSVTE
jgi:hypothetical protein